MWRDEFLPKNIHNLDDYLLLSIDWLICYQLIQNLNYLLVIKFLSKIKKLGSKKFCQEESAYVCMWERERGRGREERGRKRAGHKLMRTRFMVMLYAMSNNHLNRNILLGGERLHDRIMIKNSIEWLYEKSKRYREKGTQKGRIERGIERKSWRKAIVKYYAIFFLLTLFLLEYFNG